MKNVHADGKCEIPNMFVTYKELRAYNPTSCFLKFTASAATDQIKHVQPLCLLIDHLLINNLTEMTP